jgi:DNA polymerase
MTILYCDFETRSRCDLKAKGVYNYAQHSSTRVLCLSYAFDDEDVQTWTPGQPFPARIAHHTGQIRAHNAAFERLIWWYVLAPDVGLPEPRLEQFYCTAAQARANCAPGSLEDVGRFSGASMKKDHKGSALIRKLCIPQADGTFNDDAGLMAEMVAYCEQDVRAMRAISEAQRELSADELADYHVNERINDRGVLLDRPLAAAAVRYASAELVEIQNIVKDVTAGAITSVRSPKMRQWVLERVGPEALKLATVYKDGVAKQSIDKNVRANLLALAEENPDEVPAEVAEVIQCADDLWASSVAKFSRAASLADDEDGRVRGAFVFAGGSATGRASSYGLQVHNYPRKCAEDPALTQRAMIRGHEIVPQFGRRVTDVLKGMLRPSLMAAPGKRLVVADWAAIEARVTPWASDTEAGVAKLDLFRKGEDIYKVNAAATFGCKIADVDKDQRQVGKVQELACLSEDTLVSTTCGEKPIQDVLPGDQVWDGHNWVRTDGAIYKGEKYVIEYDGLCATPDHLVWVEGQAHPIEFGTAAIDGLRLVRTRPPHEAVVSITGEASDRSQTALREHQVAGVQDIRRAGNYVPVSLSGERICVGLGEHWPTPFWDGTRQGRQHQGLRAGEPSLVVESAEPKAYFADGEHTGAAQVSSGVPGSPLRGQHYEEPFVDGSIVRTDSRTMGPPKLQAKRRVWDLLNCGPLHRFTASGRLVHNCGFAGGIGAFASMGRIYGLHMPDSEAQRMVNAWRRANRWAVPYWDALEQAYRRAMRNPNQEFSAGRVTYLFDRLHLWYALPSGRVLCYPFARFDDEGNVTYAKAAWKPAADAKEWPRGRLWRGLACENVTQAVANDLLRHALRQMDEVVLHVHDEIVLEAKHPEEAAERLVAVMCTPPSWAKGLPLAAEVAIMDRYGK